MKYEFILIFFSIQFIIINSNDNNSTEKEEEEDEIIFTYCPSSQDPYNFENDTEKLYYFSSGLINKSMTMKEMNLNQTSKSFIESINNNYKCGYINKKLNKRYPNKSGLFIGIGLNLALFQDFAFLKLSSSFEMKMKNFFKQTGQNLSNEYQKLESDDIKKKTSFTNPELNQLNEVLIKYFSNYFYKNLDSIYHKQRIISPFIASYIQILSNEDEIKKFNNNFENLANIINYQIMGSRFSTKISSIFFSLETINCNHENHIIFITGVINDFEEKKTLIETMKNLIIKTKHKYSLIIVNENSAIKQIEFTIDINVDDLYEKISCKNIHCKMNLTKAFETSEIIVNKLFKYNYTNKKNIVLFVHTNFTENNTKNLIDNMKRKGYNILIYANSSINLFHLNDKNIVYLENFVSFKEYQNSFKSTICYFPFQILLENNELNNLKKGNLTNLYIDDEKSPHYFKIIPNSNNNKTYNISISIKNNKIEPYFNIFVSRKNPFPDIKDYTIKHYGIGNLNPELHIKTNNTFYISVIGDKLNYDIFISEIKNKNYSKYSNGIFTSNKYNKTIEGMGYYSFKIQPFLNTTLFGLKQDKTLFNILKYCRRGINKYNTIDGDFMNIDLLKFFKMFITTVYFDKTNNNTYIGNHFKLNGVSASYLLSKNFSIILFNKLYSLISFENVYDGNTLLYYLEKENIELLEREIIFLLNLTKQEEMNKIERILSATVYGISENLKFLFYLNRFILKIKSQRLIKLIFQMTKTEIANEKILKELKLINNNEIKLFNTFIIDIEKKNLFTESPILISFVIGKSLLKSQKFIDFLKQIIPLMNFYISLTTYDNKNRKQLIYDFLPLSIQDLEELKFKKLKEPIEIESELDFQLILNDQKKLFNQYDKGIKKILVILSDENIIENKTLFNHKLTNVKTIPDINKTDFNLLIMTNKKYSLNDDIFIKENFSFYDNIFYFTDLKKDYDEFLRLTKSLPIKIVCNNQKILSNFEQNQIQYYEINCENSSHLSFNGTDISIYKSKEFFPNNLSNSLFINGNYSSVFENGKNIIDFNYYSSKYFSLVSHSKNILLIDFSKNSNQSNNNKLIFQILFLIIAIIGLLIFASIGLKIGKNIQRRINNYE